ncbi:hypothetical protein [Pseudoalteromonas rhizosphaerae]|uniref:Integrase n=1 Tax=Pseudoalteromonas rhizosphaerae TaxID=2518973 RepID=A0ABW8KZE1_9GAMM
MCQLEDGALFKMKREKVKELKPVLELIRNYKSASQETKKQFYVRALDVVYFYEHMEAVKGFHLTSELIRKRAQLAGLPS